MRRQTLDVPRPTSEEQLAFLPLTHLSRLVETRRVTSTELTRLYLARLKKYDPLLHCVVSLTEELALRQARQADTEIAEGRYRGPLHGIPYGLKDLFAVRGTRTTWGMTPFKDRVIDVDSTVYERLTAAGAVLLAKLSTGAIAVTARWFGGLTRNPWNLEQDASGSSAGPGAAIPGAFAWQQTQCSVPRARLLVPRSASALVVVIGPQRFRSSIAASRPVEAVPPRLAFAARWGSPHAYGEHGPLPGPEALSASRAVHAILAVECASFEDRNPHGREVAAADERTFCEERSRRIAASLFAEPEAGAAV